MKQELASYGPYRVGDLVDISMEPVDVEVLSGTERFLTVSWPWYVTDARRELEAQGLLLCCQGARPNVYPSGMQRQMELGRYAYMLERAKRPLDVVDVLAPADPGEVGTLEEQRQFVFGFYGLSPTRRSTGRTPADAEERPCLTAMYAAGPSRGGMLSQVLEYVDPVSEAELDELEELCAAATPGPWFVRVLDDDAAMNLVAVSTRDGSRSATEPWPQFDNGEIVAATLVQSPRYVDIDDERWDENAVFIAEAREAVPRLVAEVRRLKRQIESVSGPLP